MQFTANQTVTFTLQSGSTGSITSAGFYTAPGPLVSKQSEFGCNLVPPDHVFYTKASNLPVDVATTTYLHAQISAAPVTAEIDMPDQSYSIYTPTTSLVFANSGTNGSYQVDTFPNLRVENGLFTDSKQVDQHILSMNKDTCIATELYKLYPIPYQGSGSCTTCNSGSGVSYGDTYDLSQGVDAAGLAILPLTDGYQEIKNCVDNGVPIKHALRVTFSIGIMSNLKVWPAVATAADGGRVPFGERFRLKSTFSLTGSAGAQCIEQQLKDYGCFANDGGINGHIQLRQDAVGDYTLLQSIAAELPGITGLNTDNFEAVDESTFEDLISTSPTYQKGRVNPTNAFQTPETFAVVIASNTTTHEWSTMPVIITPVTIGVDKPLGYSFMAGTPQTHLNVWVHSSTDTTLSCTMSPTLGTLTSAGIYTPPSSAVARSSTSVTCMSTTDHGATVKFPIYVYPLDGIRERLSNDTNVNYGPDVNSKTWFTEAGAYWRLQGHANCDWSAETWTGVTDSALYKQCEYVSGGSGDFFFKFNVPNGIYQTKLYFAVGGGPSPFSRGSWIQAIDSQGSIYAGNSAATMTGGGPWTELGLTGKQIDVCDITGSCASQLPGTVTLNQTVTDGSLYFAVRHLAPNGAAQPASLLNAFSVNLVSSGTAPGLSVVDAGAGINEIVTVESSNTFRIVFEAQDNWGLSQWYDLVNDPNATTNLALAFSVNGNSNLCSRENGIPQLTLYGDADKKLSMYEAGCNFSGSARSMSIVSSCASEVVIQTTGHPTDATPDIDNNLTGTLTYSIFPDGRIYVHEKLAAVNAQDLTGAGTVQNFTEFVGLNNPAATGTIPPDVSVGWVRASTTQNPYEYVGSAENYVFAYWDPTTPTYGNFTKASIMVVPSPNNPADMANGQIQHSWGCGTGCGTVRWGYGNDPTGSTLNLGAGGNAQWDFLIQLGSQNSGVLPDMTSSAVCDPIANAYRSNPSPASSCSSNTPVFKSQSRGSVIGRPREQSR